MASLKERKKNTRTESPQRAEMEDGIGEGRMAGVGGPRDGQLPQAHQHILNKPPFGYSVATLVVVDSR
jgi:hypothetical protein